MVLDSQSQRRGMGGGYSPRRRKSRLPQIVGVIVVLLGVAWLSYSWIVGGKHTAEAPPAAVGVDNSTPAPAPAPTPSPRTALVDSSSTKPAPVAPTPAPAPTPTPAPIAPRTPPTPTPAAPTGTAIGTAPTPAPAPLPAPRVASGELSQAVEQSRSLAAAGKLLDARTALNKALAAAPASADAQAARDQLTTLNQTLIFSPKIDAGDTCTESYVVQTGDALAKIAQTNHVPWEFLSQINGNLDPNRMRVGQRLKLIKGPFNVVVHKKDFRLDVYLGNYGTPDAVFIRSFRIGLGEHGSTPQGNFTVRNRLVDPPWTNPRTGERFNAKDPKNPLGGRWVGLRGVDADTASLKGYGIHGTIVPESIGTEASMGCVRLLPEDIKLLYTMLEPEQTRVTIED